MTFYDKCMVIAYALLALVGAGALYLAYLAIERWAG